MEIVEVECKILSAQCSRRLHKVRNVRIVMTKVTVTQLQTSEDLGWIAQENYVFVRN
jgi:hypothetical protein